MYPDFQVMATYPIPAHLGGEEDYQVEVSLLGSEWAFKLTQGSRWVWEQRGLEDRESVEEWAYNEFLLDQPTNAV